MQVAYVFVRLFAIYFFMRNAYFVPAVMFSLADTGQFINFQLLTTAMNIFICILLFAFPRVVMIGLKSPSKEDAATVDVSNSVQSAGVALIGLYFALEGLQRLLNFLILLATSGRWQNSAFSADVWGAVIAVIVGLILVVTSGGVSRIFNWLRKLGPRVDEEHS